MKNKRNFKKLYWLLFLLVVIGLFWLWSVLNTPVPQYQTLIVRKSSLQQSVLATGKLMHCVKLMSVPRSVDSFRPLGEHRR